MIGNNNTTLSSQQLGDINAQVASARAQKSDAESKARIIRDALKRGAATEISDVMNSELLRRLSEQQVTLRAQLAEQSSTLLDQHPRIKELRAQIADLDAADTHRGRASRDRLRERRQLVRPTGCNRSAQRSTSSRSRPASSNEQDVKLRALEREAKSQRDLLESYLAKYREATARDNIGASSPEARIISRGDRLQHAVLAEEAADRADRVARDVHAGGRLHPDRPVDERAAAGAASAPVPVAPAAAPVAAPPPLFPPLREPSSRAAGASRQATERVAAATASPSSRQFAGREVARALDAGTAKPRRARNRSGAHRGSRQGRRRPRRRVDGCNRQRAGAVDRLACAAAGVPADAIEGLAAALGTAGDSGRRVAVVGARRNMGTTLAAISLARALAKQGRVVLVDLALESPNLSVIASDRECAGPERAGAGVGVVRPDHHARPLFARAPDHGRERRRRQRRDPVVAAALRSRSKRCRAATTTSCSTPARCRRSRRRNSPGLRRARCWSRTTSTVPRPNPRASGSCRRASPMSACWRARPMGRNTMPAASGAAA